MHSATATVAALLFTIRALAQTPPGSSPATNSNLAVSYGSNQVTPGIMLAQSATRMIPIFNYQPSSAGQTYTLLMVDLSIPSSRVEPSRLAPEQLPIAPGISANRTTRLHFWQAGLTFSSDGTLVNTTEPVAFYQGPSPPPGDIPHDYVFYLFQQEAGFAPPADDSPFNVQNVNTGMTNRMSFNVQKFATQDGVGGLAAANYIMVQNSNGTGASSTGGSSAGGGASSTIGSPTASATSPVESPFTGAASTTGLSFAVASIALIIVAGFLA